MVTVKNIKPDFLLDPKKKRTSDSGKLDHISLAKDLYQSSHNSQDMEHNMSVTVKKFNMCDV